MAKRVHRFEILAPVSGSFTGRAGRIRYSLEPGVVREPDIDPDVLAVLLATGTAVQVSTRAAKSAGNKESR